MPTKKKKHAPKPDMARLFMHRFKELAGERGWDLDWVVSQSHGALKHGTARRYWDGHRWPRTENIMMIAKIFGISPAELLKGMPLSNSLAAKLQELSQ